MAMLFFKLTARTPTKNRSQGIHGEEWRLCDLRKELCAHGRIGSPFLRKTDLIQKISKCEPNKVLDCAGLLLGASNEEQTSKEYSTLCEKTDKLEEAVIRELNVTRS